VRGGTQAAVAAIAGSKAVAEGAVLEARPAKGQAVLSSAAAATGPGSMLVLRGCELRGGVLHPSRSDIDYSLMVAGGARGTAADCTCSGAVVVSGPGSLLLHSGMAFVPSARFTFGTGDGGVARELPAAAGVAGGRAAVGAPPPAAP
jgi:hypothetical protein